MWAISCGPSACEYLGFNGNEAPRRAGEHLQFFFPARQQHFASTQFFGCDAYYVNQFLGVEDVSFLAYDSKLPTDCVQLLPALRLRQPLQKLPLLPRLAKFDDSVDISRRPGSSISFCPVGSGDLLLPECGLELAVS
jgi:hypothetical protein